MNCKRKVVYPDCYLNSNIWSWCWLMFRLRLVWIITIFKMNRLFQSKIWHFSCVGHLVSIDPPSLCNSAYICRMLDRLCSSMCVLTVIGISPTVPYTTYSHRSVISTHPYPSIIQSCWNHHITIVFGERIRLPLSFSSTWTGKTRDHAHLSSQ
jgi:hypothetical protein